MSMKKFHNVICHSNQKGPDLEKIWGKIDQIAYLSSPIGICEYVLEEEEIDDLLGKKAFTGGEVDAEIYDQVEASASEQSSSRLYSFDDSQRDAALDFINSLKDQFSDLRVQIEVVEEDEEVWNQEWMKNFRPILIDDLLEVIPAWEKEQHEMTGRTPIFIYPGRGFGTGSHETTKMCLQFLSDLNLKEETLTDVLDFGCGSGILGIGALKLAHKQNIKSEVLFCDIDSNALDNTVQNIDLNFEGENLLEGSSIVIRSKLKLQKQYDLVFANILYQALLDESEILKSSVKDDGYLILSGLLVEQKSAICEHFVSLGFSYVNERIDGDWCALLLKRS